MSKVKRRVISFEEASEFAKAHGLEYIETSAKENTNVSEGFVSVAEKILAKIENGTIDPENEVR